MDDIFKRETERREKPSCFGNHKTESVKDRVKCGTCWFSHLCKDVKPVVPPVKKPQVKKAVKK